LVRGTDGAIRPDLTGRAHGRGAYLHADAACFAAARTRRALERSLKGDVHPELWAELTALM